MGFFGTDLTTPVRLADIGRSTGSQISSMKLVNAAHADAATALTQLKYQLQRSQSTRG